MNVPKCIVILITLSGLSTPLPGQKFVVEKSLVSFFATAPVENVEAVNQKAFSSFDAGLGEIFFSVPVKGFIFKRSLMQKHFNEKYMETEKFPESTFQGTIAGFDPKVGGSQQTVAQGRLTVHGVTKNVKVSGQVEIATDMIRVKAKFIVRLEDFAIEQPQLFWRSMVDQVDVSIDFVYKPADTK